jgi:hypothetical protein
VRPARQGLLPLLLVMATAAAGCGQNEPQRQYAPRTPGTSIRSDVSQPGGISYPTPRAGSAYDDPSTGIATVASAVPGAGAVTAVVLGNVALVGIPNPDPGVHRKVAEQVRASFQHIAEVRITTDPAVIGHLFQANQMIQQNQSVAPLLPDLGARSATLTPLR